ncbi:MAG: MFS transporter [Flavobacteriales bacterium]
MGRSFFTLVSVFFFWGFLAASNGIFIPFCKTHFHLSQFQSQLIDSAFYGAYFIGSLLLYMFSLRLNRDIINHWGYKKTIIYGLLISILGAAAMIPSVNAGSFVFILSSFFLIALGFSLQQTSANPLVLNVGNPASGSHRLNFAGSINSLGTTIGPILVSLLLFGKLIALETDKKGASIESINTLYIILGGAFALAAVILALTKINKLDIEEQDQKEMSILKAPLIFILVTLLVLAVVFLYFPLRASSKGPVTDESVFLFSLSGLLFLLSAVLYAQYVRMRKSNRISTESHPHVTLGMLAIFMYVGVEVTIQSNLGSLLKETAFGGLSDSEISPYISLYWGSLMIGRWTGSLGAFRMSKTINFLLTIIVPLAAFALVLFMNYLSGAGIQIFYPYLICVAVLVAAFIITKQKPALTLMVFSLLATMAMIIGLCSTGMTGTFAFMSGGLFCSIMWPSIFSLATAGLGKYTSQASAFLIMMILGGAFIPPLQGLIADKTGNIHFSYILTVACFLYLAFYAWQSKRILIRKGIDYDGQLDSGN